MLCIVVDGIGLYGGPLHNFASYGADAFRMLAVGIGKLVNKGLSAEEWRHLREENMV